MKKPLILSFLISLMVLEGCPQIELEQANKVDEGDVLQIKHAKELYTIV